MSAGPDFNVEFCRALGLDPNTTASMTLRLSPLEPPRLIVEFVAINEDELLRLVRLYRLELDDAATWEDL